ncbi:hypothetical protein BC831DRAFT_547595 [Entophlyctis helioformis]|nr:hypothetical protein BC831DRAFT_547595 [Entophlyctis helioformis]
MADGHGDSDDDWETMDHKPAAVVLPIKPLPAASASAAAADADDDWGAQVRPVRSVAASGPVIIETNAHRTEYVPQIKLLKRTPSQAGSTASGQESPQGSNPAIAPAQSLEERKAAYDAARARIFGESDRQSSKSTLHKQQSKAQPKPSQLPSPLPSKPPTRPK